MKKKSATWRVASARIDVLESAIKLLLRKSDREVLGWTDTTMGQAIDANGNFVNFDDPKAVAWTLSGAVRVETARYGIMGAEVFAGDLLDLVWDALAADRIRPKPLRPQTDVSEDERPPSPTLWSDWEDGLPSSSVRMWNGAARDVGQVVTLLGITAFRLCLPLGPDAVKTLARRLEPLLCVAR